MNISTSRELGSSNARLIDVVLFAMINTAMFMLLKCAFNAEIVCKNILIVRLKK